MQFTRKFITAFSLSLIILLNPLYASGVEWKELKGLERDLLSEHKSNWSGYGETKRTILFNKANKKANKLRKYRKWEKKHLSAKESKELRKNFKRMNDKQFKKYMDRLFKKYGRA